MKFSSLGMWNNKQGYTDLLKMWPDLEFVHLWVVETCEKSRKIQCLSCCELLEYVCLLLCPFLTFNNMNILIQMGIIIFSDMKFDSQYFYRHSPVDCGSSKNFICLSVCLSLINGLYLNYYGLDFD